MSEAERIAAALTTAQREAILAVPFAPVGHGFAPATLRSLREGPTSVRGIGVQLMDYRKLPYGKSWYLTPLGLAVRAHLEGEP